MNQLQNRAPLHSCLPQAGQIALAFGVLDFIPFNARERGILFNELAEELWALKSFFYLLLKSAIVVNSSYFRHVNLENILEVLFGLGTELKLLTA